MTLQEIAVTALATYGIVRFITEDTSLKTKKHAFLVYATVSHHKKTKKFFLNLFHKLIMWPYWTTIIVLPIILLIPQEATDTLSILGLVYLVYDIRRD